MTCFCFCFSFAFPLPTTAGFGFGEERDRAKKYLYIEVPYLLIKEGLPRARRAPNDFLPCSFLLYQPYIPRERVCGVPYGVWYGTILYHSYHAVILILEKKVMVFIFGSGHYVIV